MPTLDMLPAIFGLQGEDIDDAILYEGWVELWLAVALATTLAPGLRRIARPRRPLHATVAASSCGAMVPTPMAPPCNVANVLLWLVGGACSPAPWSMAIERRSFSAGPST